MDGEPQEDILDRCIQRLLQGEPLDRVLRSYPDQQPQLRAALQPALALLQSNTPDPSPRADYAAMNAMLRQVRTEAERPELPGVIRWLGTLRARPLAFQGLALVAAIAVFSSIGLGASAATGRSPEPVRVFLGISSNPQTARVAGSVVSVESRMLVLRTTAGDRSIELTSATMFRRGDQKIDITNLTVGETVLVTASEMRDGALVAREVRAAAPPTPTDTAVVPAVPATDDAVSDTPAAPAGDDHGDDDGSASSTPEPDGDDGEEHDATPGVSATPDGGDDEHATRTPDDDDRKTPDGEHDDDPTKTPDGDGGADDGHG